MARQSATESAQPTDTGTARRSSAASGPNNESSSIAPLSALADQPLLGAARHEAAAAVEELPAHEPPRARGGGAVHRIEQPVVEAERAVEPHHVVDGRHLHARLEEAHAVRIER